ncbi:MAG TPA: tryptophan halogenase family protein [Rhizomicrobium sp.]|jgi:tryptophan halogenase
MNETMNGGAEAAPDKHLRKIVIVGGGSAGWMTAAALCVATKRENCQLVLVESDQIGTIGVGESTVPPIKDFNWFLGINEKDFVVSTQASFKLAIQYVDWTRIGHVYFNPLEGLGFSELAGGNADLTIPAVYQYLLKLAVHGHSLDLKDYSMCSTAAGYNRFDHPKNAQGSTFAYAYQFDASLYAKNLRLYAEHRGVERIEGKVADVVLRPEDGFIDSIILQSGQRIDGDLFIDCTGFRALLIGETLKIPYEDWSHWLPCDRALAVPCRSTGPLLPYTRATAREAGWQWRIPLQHRTGNGYVFSSKFIDEQKAADRLLANLDGEALDSPRLLKFTTGRRKEMWTKNCVAIGLSSGFIEPLESTSIHLIQEGIMRLVKLLPDRDFSPLIIREYNGHIAGLFEWIRDFIVMHYHATEREDTEFWRYCKYMSVPDKLRFRMEMFRKHGHISIDPSEGFRARPWMTAMYNQGVVPQSYPPLTDMFDDHVMRTEAAKLREGVLRTVQQMPSHEEYIAHNCKAPAVAV